ncbi:MAG: RNA polymerase sigma factor [Verrucomicrobiales bacterium]
MKTSVADVVLDEQAVIEQCLRGDREAFAILIDRYQNLVCAITYSIAGRVQESEELAHEAFVTAWKQLHQLQDLAKFRQWLCGIARNISQSWLRRHLQERSRTAEADLAQLTSSVTPTIELISQEEERLVWDALEQIPENYREPLVLFYREGDSVADVAQAMGITEETVRQRLSRGRAMLKQEVANKVEGCLRRTRPGRGLTLAIVASLPAFAPGVVAATLGASSQTAAGAKTAAAIGMGGAVAGPLIGMAGAFIGAKASLNAAKSEAERKFVWTIIWGGGLYVGVFLVALFSLIYFGKAMLPEHPVLFGSLAAGLVISYMIGLFLIIMKVNARQRQIQMEQGTFVPMEMMGRSSSKKMTEGQIYGSLFGTVGGGLCWLVMRAFQTGEWMLVGQVAAIGALLFLAGVQFMKRYPKHANRVMFGIIGAVLAVTLIIINSHPDIFWMNYPGKWGSLGALVINGFIILLFGLISLSIWLNLHREAKLASEWERKNAS